MATRLSVSMSVPARFEWQADVVFGHRGRGRFRLDQVVQFGVLKFLSDRSGVRESVHERSEPPREARGLPDTTQTSRRILVEPVLAAFLIALDQRPRQVVDIGGSQVQALGAGG